jgi:hypothetical protein
MEAFSSYFSLGVSICTAVTTFALWVLKANRELPRLKVYAADPQIGGWAQSSCGDPIRLAFEVKTVVANYSTLPNAVLGVHASVLMRDGSWRDAEARIDAKTPMPLNLAPLQTVKLDLSFVLAVPAVSAGEACRNTHETYALYRDRFLTQPLQVRVALTTLGEKQFADVLRAGGSAGTAPPLAKKAA